MSEIEFEEQGSSGQFTSQQAFTPIQATQPSFLARLIYKTGIVKTEKGVFRAYIVLVIFFISATLFVILNNIL
jgi:hypothetical protein